MSKKYKVIPEDLQKSLIEFLDEVQFDAATEGDTESMHKVNFCTWAINELLNGWDAYLKDIRPKKKSRDQYLDETFMDWNLPEMSDEDYEKLVDKFDAFLRSWEKEYNKKNPKKKPIKDRPSFHKPHIDDVAEYMSLEEIGEYLKDDPELTKEERFDLYYEEHQRVKRAKQRRKDEKDSVTYEQMMKNLGIKPSNWKPEDEEKN